MDRSNVYWHAQSGKLISPDHFSFVRELTRTMLWAVEQGYVNPSPKAGDDFVKANSAFAAVKVLERLMSRQEVLRITDANGEVPALFDAIPQSRPSGGSNSIYKTRMAMPQHIARHPPSGHGPGMAIQSSEAAT